jgi:single-strand DNA-binding protein
VAGINKVILVGNLGQDPDTGQTGTGNSVTNISVATSKAWRDRDSGEQKEKTEWHRVVFFNRLAEIAAQYLRKGSKVYIEGELRTNEWEKEGHKHYTTQVVAQEMLMFDSRGGTQEPDSDDGVIPSGNAGAPDYNDGSPPF